MTGRRYAAVAAVSLACGTALVLAINLQSDPFSGELAELLRLIGLAATFVVPFTCGAFVAWWGWKPAATYSLIQVAASSTVTVCFGDSLRGFATWGPVWAGVLLLPWGIGRALRWARLSGYV